MTFVQNQWYVAAYAAEVGRSLLGPDRSCGEPIVLYRASSGRPVALADRCVHRRFPLSQSQPGRRHDRLRLPRLHLRDRRPAACPCPASSASRARPGSPATRSSSRTRSSGCGSATRTAPTPRSSRARRGWTDGRYTTVRRHGAAGRPVRPAGRQPARPVPRDLPARRLHRHPEVAETPITTEVDEDARHRPRQPAHGRRRLPAVLRRVHRHQGPDHPLAGHRVPPAVPVPAAQPDRPGRRAAPAGRHRPGRLPRRGRLRDHPVDRDTSRYDFWAVARDFALGDEAVSDVPARRATAPWCCRTSPRSTCWSRSSPPSRRGLPGAAASTSTPAAWPRGESSPGWRPGASSGSGRRRDDDRATCRLPDRLAAGHRPAARHLPLRRRATARTRSSCGTGCSPTRTTTEREHTTMPDTAELQPDRRRRAPWPTGSSPWTCATRPARRCRRGSPARTSTWCCGSGCAAAVLAVRRPGRPPPPGGSPCCASRRPRRLRGRARRTRRGQPGPGPRPAQPLPARARRRYLFVAGGIGITPILPMLAADAAGRDHGRWSTAGAPRASMAFTPRTRRAVRRRGCGSARRTRPGCSTSPAILGQPADRHARSTAAGPSRLLDAVRPALRGLAGGHAARRALRPAAGHGARRRRSRWSWPQSAAR